MKKKSTFWRITGCQKSKTH